MKFLVDSMLGRLAKWLRILGYDTLYFSSLEDSDLVRIARAEGRMVLTRDREMTRRRGIDCLFVENEHFREQIRQVLRDLNLQADSSFTRCPVCNTPLQPLEKRDAQGRVPPYVYKTQERFSLCPGCQRIYWRGTHWERMKGKIEGWEGAGDG